ncbi:MAG: hypothetical protein AB1591_10355 [Pseudomonadota bacterium]
MYELPQNPSEWLAEIASAYSDAFETLPFMELVGSEPDENVLFHLAPQVAVKFRGLPKEKVAAAADAAFSSYVASKEKVGGVLDDPHIAFAFCHLAAQFGLEILSEQTIMEVMAFVEKNEETLHKAVTQAIHNA